MDWYYWYNDMVDDYSSLFKTPLIISGAVLFLFVVEADYLGIAVWSSVPDCGQANQVRDIQRLYPSIHLLPEAC